MHCCSRLWIIDRLHQHLQVQQQYTYTTNIMCHLCDNYECTEHGPPTTLLHLGSPSHTLELNLVIPHGAWTTKHSSPSISMLGHHLHLSAVVLEACLVALQIFFGPPLPLCPFAVQLNLVIPHAAWTIKHSSPSSCMLGRHLHLPPVVLEACLVAFLSPDLFSRYSLVHLFPFVHLLSSWHSKM